MARKTWSSLSAAYRKRLRRGGIDQRAYESGANLSRARGHRATPEHPQDVERTPEKYARYRNLRSGRMFPAFVWQSQADADGNGIPPFDMAIYGTWSTADRFKIARHWHAIRDYDFSHPSRFDSLFAGFRRQRIGGSSGIPRMRFEVRQAVIEKWLRDFDETAPYEDLYEYAEDLAS